MGVTEEGRTWATWSQGLECCQDFLPPLTSAASEGLSHSLWLQVTVLFPGHMEQGDIMHSP